MREPTRSVLIVEDNVDLAANLGDYLESEGWEPDFAHDGPSALALTKTNDYDVVVLDLTLPRLDGLDVARRIRAELARPPSILMLTARDTLQDKLDGFEAGADDYLVKPFALQELRARIDALSRRFVATQSEQRLGDVVLRAESLEAWSSGSRLHLSPTEFSLLALLIERAPGVLSHRDVARHVWPSESPSAGALRTHIYNLRGALEPSTIRIETVRGVGFRLVTNDPNGGRV